MSDPFGRAPARSSSAGADLATRLEDGLLVLDAAMGTRLLALGLRLEDDDPCLWNRSRPEAVLAVHRRDVGAGAEAVLTNTFGANRVALGRFRAAGAAGAAVDLGAINRAAVALARQAAGPTRWVIGDIGPTAADGDAVVEQADVLRDAGVDALLLETHRLDQAESALRQLGPEPGVPVLVSLLAWPDPAAADVARLTSLGAHALGANCQDGMEEALAIAARLRRCTSLPLILKPAAASPRRAGPPDGPDAFARAVPVLRTLAPVLVGGCCGTTELHLAPLRRGWYHAPSGEAAACP